MTQSEIKKFIAKNIMSARKRRDKARSEKEASSALYWAGYISALEMVHDDLLDEAEDERN